MASFKDTSGREWELAVNVTTIKRLRASSLKLDLLDVGDRGNPVLARLATDPILLVDVLYVLCKPQADASGVTDEQFGEAMAGEVIDQATEALLAEIVNFIPSPMDKARAIRALEKMRQGLTLARTALNTQLENLDVEAMVAEELGNSSTNLPVSSESTRDRSLSAS